MIRPVPPPEDAIPLRRWRSPALRLLTKVLHAAAGAWDVAIVASIEIVCGGVTWILP